mgnify:CR=1 FL=1
MLRNKQLSTITFFDSPVPLLRRGGSLTHSQALALSKRARDVTALLGAVFLKSSRPSLPLKKAPPLISIFFSQGRRGKPPYSVLEPLRYKVGGPKRSRQIMRDGTARGGKAICKYLNFLIWIEVLKETGSSLL